MFKNKSNLITDIIRDEYKLPFTKKLIDEKPNIPYKFINKPMIFTKSKSPIKTINFINNDSGKMKHFTPAAQEWYNSIYSYNNNYTKLLPRADKNLMMLLRSYFNFFVNHKILRTKRMLNRYRKLSANKIFVGKGELKHTNNRIVITSYIYNVQEFYLKGLLAKQSKLTYYTNKILKQEVNINKTKKNVIVYNRPFTIHEFLNKKHDAIFPCHILTYKEACFKLFWKEYIKLIGIDDQKSQEKNDIEKEKLFENKHGGKEGAKLFLNLVKLKTIGLNNATVNSHYENIIKIIHRDIFNNTNNFFIDKENIINTYSINIDNLNYNELKFKDKIEILFLKNFDEIYSNNINFTDSLFFDSHPIKEKEKNKAELLIFKEQILKIRNILNNFENYIRLAEFIYFKQLNKLLYLLMINTAKFKTPFVSKLVYLIENIYKKDVELNIVNLNKIHLNSDIYTQVVALKLKNRDNNLFRVLRLSLSKVKLPNINRRIEKDNLSNRGEYLVNKIRNKYINSMFNSLKGDPLNNLLLHFFSNVENLKMDIKKRLFIKKQSISLSKYIIRSLKHLKIAGIRVEAKGRLTRRFTASRSVFKMRWKGGLKNVDSSFKGLSAIMLRGDRKSNVQYSLINSKNRNGAYGVKGWVSSK